MFESKEKIEKTDTRQYWYCMTKNHNNNNNNNKANKRETQKNTYRKRVSNKKIFLYNLNIVLLSTPRLDYVNDIISSLTNVLHCVFVDQKSKEKVKKEERRKKKEERKKKRKKREGDIQSQQNGKI